MNTPTEPTETSRVMSLYNRCLVTIIKNDVEVDFLPKPLLEDIKLLHSLHQKMD